MDAKHQEYEWASNRTKQIIIQDDTCKGDMIQWRSLFFLKYEDRFTLMVNPDDTIGAIKAYIQEERGIAFKKQKILSQDGEDLSDVETLVSLKLNTDSFLILQYAPVIAQLSVRMLLMSFIVKDPWTLSRTMEIIIHDDTYKNVIKFRSVSKTRLPVRGPDDTGGIINNDCRISYTLMVGPEDTIAAVKAYIQEKTGFYFNKQKLLNEVGEGTTEVVLRDNAQTLSSLGIKKGSALILRNGCVYKVPFTHKRSGCIFYTRIKPGDTIGDVKAAIQKKACLSKLRLTYRGRRLPDHELMFDLYD